MFISALCMKIGRYLNDKCQNGGSNLEPLSWLSIARKTPVMKDITVRGKASAYALTLSLTRHIGWSVRLQMLKTTYDFLFSDLSAAIGRCQGRCTTF